MSFQLIYKVPCQYSNRILWISADSLFFVINTKIILSSSSIWLTLFTTISKLLWVYVLVLCCNSLVLTKWVWDPSPIIPTSITNPQESQFRKPATYFISKTFKWCQIVATKVFLLGNLLLLWKYKQDGWCIQSLLLRFIFLRNLGNFKIQQSSKGDQYSI